MAAVEACLWLALIRAEGLIALLSTRLRPRVLDADSVTVKLDERRVYVL
jgi:hypothetical protein